MAIESEKERERESERVTASFVVHHVERILFLSFFSRSLLLLLMLMRFFFLARALSLSSDVSSSKNDHPTLTYEREKKSAYTHILTHSKARSCVDLKYIENDAKLSAAYCGIRHAEP